jgi:uncharacterized protein DUF5666
MHLGTRSKLVGLMTGAILLLGAGSAFAATNNMAPEMANGHRGGPGAMWRQHHGFVVFGKITHHDGDTFTLATRMGDVKVHVDHNTTFKNGSKDDLDNGKIVAVAGKKTARDKVDADLVVFIQHPMHWKR